MRTIQTRTSFPFSTKIRSQAHTCFVLTGQVLRKSKMFAQKVLPELNTLAASCNNRRKQGPKACRCCESKFQRWLHSKRTAPRTESNLVENSLSVQPRKAVNVSCCSPVSHNESALRTHHVSRVVVFDQDRVRVIRTVQDVPSGKGTRSDHLPDSAVLKVQQSARARVAEWSFVRNGSASLRQDDSPGSPGWSAGF